MKNVLTAILIVMMVSATTNAVVIPGVGISNFSDPPESVDPSSWQYPWNVVNGAGFTPIDPNGWTGTHSDQRGVEPSGPGYNWYTNNGETAGNFIEFDLASSGYVTSLNRIKVWNWNWDLYLDGGIQDMNISLYDSNGDLISDLGTYTLAQAAGDTLTDFGQILDIPDTAGVRYVRFTIETNYGNTKPRSGLSEVRFDGDYFGAGADQSIEITGTSVVANLSGVGSGNPITWSVDSKPAAGTVIFGDPDSEATTATLDWPGTYVLRLTNDNDTNIFDTVTIEVYKTVIAAAADSYLQLLGSSVSTSLDGTCTTAATWSYECTNPVGEEGAADEMDYVPGTLDQTVTFNAPGTYSLTLTDNIFGVSDTVDVTVVQAPLANGLIGYWPFDGNTNDGSGNGNNGIVDGDPQYVDGQVGQAMAFDGDGDGVEIPSEWFFMDTAQELTVSCWVRMAYGTRPEGIIVGKRDYAFDTNYGSPPADKKGQGWALNWISTQTDNVWFGGYSAGGGSFGPNVTSPSYYDTYNDGQWHHFAVVIDSVGDTYFYVDGALKMDGRIRDSFNVGPTTNYWNGNPVSIGYAADFPDALNFTGEIDEVRIYNYALDATAISNQFTGDGGGCTQKQGDINGDCDVDLADFILLAQDWLK